MQADAPQDSLPLEALPARIDAWARELGFAQVAITDADVSAQRERFEQWLAAGFHGEMGWLAESVDLRFDADRLLADTCRVIIARMNYLPAGAPPRDVLANSRKAYISRYALGRDYHRTVRQRLARLARRIDAHARQLDGRFRAFADSAPVLEKPLGEKAGLGWIGKHTLLLNESGGSWFFLGEIYTNLPLPLATTTVAPGCGNCRACMTVCPTGAIVAPYQLDARRCISYLTIELDGPIPHALRPLIGNRVFGCDDCQLFCPWNRHAIQSDLPDFAPRNDLDQADLVTLFRWTEAEFLARTEGSPLRRAGYRRWRRNLAIALGNGPPDASALAILRSARADADDSLREHIDWAIARLEVDHPADRPCRP